ncbi:MAG: DUF6713 family protein [Actinomycetota bacterium]
MTTQTVENTTHGGDAQPARLPHLWLFVVAFALLLCHELDAMIRQEWDLFPGLRALSDDTAADVFNLAHLALFGIPIWLLIATSQRTQNRTIIAVEAFIIGHAVAHAALHRHDDYMFEAPVETLTVYGAAVFASAHLTLVFRQRHRRRHPTGR